MSVAARAYGAFIFCLSVAALAPGCGGDSSTASGACQQGQTRECIGPASCHGGQICEAQGANRVWGTCDCGGGAGGGTSVGGGTSAGGRNTGGGLAFGGSSGTGSGSGPIGQACATDADCGATGVTCLASSSTILGGGPPHGMCVADCSNNANACAVFGRATVCVALDATGATAYCFERCLVGNGQQCHGRGDMACDDVGSTIAGDGYCSPTCGSDADCDAGNDCDFSTGLCVPAAKITGTLPIGDACDVNADHCRGFCFPIDPTAPPTDSGSVPGACTGTCSLGAPGACGKDPTSATPAADCLYDATLLGAGGPGDLGFCGALCTCDDDCTATKHCIPFSAADATVFGRAGRCAISPASTSANIACAAAP